MLNLNKFILFFSFFAFNASAIDFSCVDLEEDEYEFDYSNEKIVSVGKKSVCLNCSKGLFQIHNKKNTHLCN